MTELFESGRILQPDELAVVQGVLDQLKAEGLLPPDEQGSREMGRYIISMYSRGLVRHHPLYNICVARLRAKANENNPEFSHT